MAGGGWPPGLAARYCEREGPGRVRPPQIQGIMVNITPRKQAEAGAGGEKAMQLIRERSWRRRWIAS